MKDVLIRAIDLTSLNENDTPAIIESLCDKAITYSVAAVCVYPKFLPIAVKRLKSHPTAVATVVNFPNGIAPLENVLSDIVQVVAMGADEIDMVMPYKALSGGTSPESVTHFIRDCKAACQGRLLKVILETGALKNDALIETAAKVAIAGGADFLKTSTGKTPIGATIPATKILLSVLKNTDAYTDVGIKVSGGVKTPEQAQAFFNLAKDVYGSAVTHKFRIGASSLLEALITEAAPN